MQVGWLPAELRGVVTQIPNRLQREQLIDELRMRTFRQTLLCHAALEIGEPRPEPVASLAVSTQARAEPADQPGAATFATPSGATLTTAEPLVVDTLQRVVAASPGAVAVASLWPPDAPAEDRDAICTALLRCYAGALVELNAPSRRRTMFRSSSACARTSRCRRGAGPWRARRTPAARRGRGCDVDSRPGCGPRPLGHRVAEADHEGVRRRGPSPRISSTPNSSPPRRAITLAPCCARCSAQGDRELAQDLVAGGVAGGGLLVEAS